ncbi:MAG: ABC transporter substrate-binding protein [Alphaproteobacteria bacterium]|nr:ABC transporter substrate-binding protein [Alphaproteobacteria bacterium]
MKRRAFTAVFGGTLASPLVARAQLQGAPRRLGVLMGDPEGDQFSQARLEAFRNRLRELGWVEGRNILLDIRWGAATRDAAHAAALARETVSAGPDIIHGGGTPAMRALRQATETIPVVFAGLADPIGDGIVASLSRPGGNITGFSSFEPAIAGKWLQLLKQVSPGITRVAAIFNPDTAPHRLFMPALLDAASSLGVTLEPATVREPPAIDAAVAALRSAPGTGLVVMPDSFTLRHRGLLSESVARHRVPAVYALRVFADDGGLMSYGSDFVDQHYRAASYVDRILKGAKPADLPVQVPSKFEFIVNLKTARALGLDPPPALLAAADEVIE